MSARATPETDAAIYCASPNESVVHLGFARKLENERDEAREERDEAFGRGIAAGWVKKLRDDRDAARAKLAKCREALENIAGCAETNARANSDSDETIALNHIADTAGETLDATK